MLGVILPINFNFNKIRGKIMKRRKIGLSARTLTSVLLWADACKRSKNYKWTKWDDNRYSMVNEAITDMLHKKYESVKRESEESPRMGFFRKVFGF